MMSCAEILPQRSSWVHVQSRNINTGIPASFLLARVGTRGVGENRGAIHSTKIPTGPTGKSGPPQKVDLFFRNFSGWSELIHWVLDRNFRKFWLNGSRPRKHSPVNLTILKNAFALKCSFSLVLVSQSRYVLFMCIADKYALDCYLFESCLREVLADLAWCPSNLTVRPLGVLWCDNRVYH